MNRCDDSVKGSTDAIHALSGGSIPASSLFWHHGETETACAMVCKHHYSHRAPSNIQHVTTAHLGGGLFGDKGEPVAAVIFSIPGTRWSVNVLELSRLVRVPHLKVPLSAMVSAAVRRIAKKKLTDLLVSFADRTQGHEGYVYRACGWNWSGTRDRQNDGLIVDGVFVPGRSANSRWGTRSASKLAEMGIVAEPHYDEGKHIYWKALTPKGECEAKLVGLDRKAWKEAASNG